MKTTKTLLASASVLLFFGSLAACNTWRGAGKDVEYVGKSIAGDDHDDRDYDDRDYDGPDRGDRDYGDRDDD